MKKKWIVYVALAGVLVVGYAIYAVFFLEKIPVGQLCHGGGQCEGECLGFGELLPDYSHEEICTKQCGTNADCPSATSCETIEVISTDGKGVETANKQYCLPAAR